MTHRFERPVYKEITISDRLKNDSFLLETTTRLLFLQLEQEHGNVQRGDVKIFETIPALPERTWKDRLLRRQTKPVRQWRLVVQGVLTIEPSDVLREPVWTTDNEENE